MEDIKLSPAQARTLSHLAVTLGGSRIRNRTASVLLRHGLIRPDTTNTWSTGKDDPRYVITKEGRRWVALNFWDVVTQKRDHCPHREEIVAIAQGLISYANNPDVTALERESVLENLRVAHLDRYKTGGYAEED